MHLIRKTKIIIITISALFFIQVSKAWADTRSDEVNDTLIKIAFVFKFLDYIDHKWKKTDNISFCFFGFSSNDFAFIQKNVAKTSYNNMKLIKKSDVESSSTCQIIYFNKDYEDSYQEVLEYIGIKPIITVSDMKYFTDNGGIIEFYHYRDKIRFFINNKSALERGIKFNAKLLELGGRRYD